MNIRPSRRLVVHEFVVNAGKRVGHVAAAATPTRKGCAIRFLCGDCDAPGPRARPIGPPPICLCRTSHVVQSRSSYIFRHPLQWSLIGHGAGRVPLTRSASGSEQRKKCRRNVFKTALAIHRAQRGSSEQGKKTDGTEPFGSAWQFANAICSSDWAGHGEHSARVGNRRRPPRHGAGHSQPMPSLGEQF